LHCREEGLFPLDEDFAAVAAECDVAECDGECLDNEVGAPAASACVAMRVFVGGEDVVLVALPTCRGGAVLADDFLAGFGGKGVVADAAGGFHYDLGGFVGAVINFRLVTATDSDRYGRFVALFLAT